MPAEELERPAAVDEIRNEVAKIKDALAEAVDDGVRSALRTMKQGRYAAEEAIEDAKHVVRKNPVGSVGLVFLAGLLTGGLIGWMAVRRKEVQP